MRGLETPNPSAVCFLLAAMTLAVFWPVVTHDFLLYDDTLYTEDIGPPGAAFSLPGLRWAFSTVHHDNWLPLTLLSHRADRQLFGSRSWGHHLSNLLLHLANVLLLFLSLRRMSGDAWRSAVVAAVFAVHPLQVESVAWIAQRKTLLSSFFCLIALWNYVFYIERPSTSRFAVLLAAFAAALMSKASALTLPCLLLLLDRWPIGRASLGWRRLVWEKAPLLALAAVAGSAAVLIAQKTPLAQLPLDVRLGNAIVSCALYLRKAVWPSGLSVFYPHPGGNLKFAWVLLQAILLACAALAALRLRAARPHVSSGGLWFLIGVGPMLGFVQVGNQAMADRYMYLPLIGLALIAAWELPRLQNARARGPALSAAGWVGALMVAASLQLRHWRSSVHLFSHAIRVDETNAFAHGAMAGALLLQGDPGQAVTHYERGLALDPSDALSHNDLGGVLGARGNLGQAIEHFAAASRLAADPALARMARYNLLRARSLSARGEGAGQAGQPLPPPAQGYSARNSVSPATKPSPDRR